MTAADVLVVGAGVFGVTAALRLAERCASVRLLDPGPLPHPDAASSDISKVVRLDYGADAYYLALMERALPRWRAWNEGWPRPLFHETGFFLLSSQAMQPGSFEGDSYAALSAAGHPLQRLDAALLRRHLAPLTSKRFVDGYYNPQGGWAESSQVMKQLLLAAQRAGVTVMHRRVAALVYDGDRVVGATTDDGTRLAAASVVVAAGVWSAQLVEALAPLVTVVGQPVRMFVPARSDGWSAPDCVPWAADIGRTGWYGFCANREGIVKVAHHGRGTPVQPDAPRVLPAGSETRFRDFLADTFAGLVQARLHATRLCLYCDSFDGDFVIARHPYIRGLVVATGGSGHAFKMAPVLGDLVADVVMGHDNPWLSRFAWRAPAPGRADAARAVG